MKLLKDINKLVEAEEKDLAADETPADETPVDVSPTEMPTEEPADEAPTPAPAPDSDDVTDDEDESGTTDADEIPVEDVGNVSTSQGFKKSKKELYAFGKTRQVTLLTKDEALGGLDLTLQYLINPATGAWKLRACLAGQSEEDMVEFDTGEDPSSLIKSLKKKNKITPHQAVEYLHPPVNNVARDKLDDENAAEVTESVSPGQRSLYNAVDKSIAKLVKLAERNVISSNPDYLRKLGNQLKASALESEKAFSKDWHKIAADHPDLLEVLADELFPHFNVNTYDDLIKKLKL